MQDKIAKEIGKAISSTLGAPLSEVSQLIADKVRFLRWKSAIKTLKRAREIADKNGGSLSCPPLKFFLPFMEGCSLEPDLVEDKHSRDLSNEWANLLNSAAHELKSDHLIYIRILKEITAREANLLSRIIADGSLQDADISFVYEGIGTFKSKPVDAVAAAIREVFSSPVSVDDFVNRKDHLIRELRVNLSSPGVSTYELCFFDSYAEECIGMKPILSFSDGLYADLGEVSVLDATDVLKYHGLLDWGDFVFELPFVLDGLPLSVYVAGASVTRLGAHFAEACISPGDELASNRG